MPRGVHRPVICDHPCRSELPEYPDLGGWLRCVICGTRRQI